MMFRAAFVIYLLAQLSVGFAKCTDFCPGEGRFYAVKLNQEYKIRGGKIFDSSLEHSGIGSAVFFRTDKDFSKLAISKEWRGRIEGVSVAFELNKDLSKGRAVAIGLSVGCGYLREELARVARIYRSSESGNPHVRDFIISDSRFKYRFYEHAGNCEIDLSLNRLLGPKPKSDKTG